MKSPDPSVLWLRSGSEVEAAMLPCLPAAAACSAVSRGPGKTQTLHSSACKSWRACGGEGQRSCCNAQGGATALLRCKEIWRLRPMLAHCIALISQEETACRRCWFLPPWCQPQQVSRNQLSMLFPGYRSEYQASGQVFGQLHSMLEVQDCQISAKIQ